MKPEGKKRKVAYGTTNSCQGSCASYLFYISPKDSQELHNLDTFASSGHWHIFKPLIHLKGEN